MNERSEPVSLIGREAFDALAERLRSDGLMDRRPGAYAIYGASMLALLVLGLYLLADGSHLAARALGAVLLAFTAVHFGSLTHDADHGEVFARPSLNRALGLVSGNLLSGISFEWWSDKHGRHHAAPNDLERDPDLYDFFVYREEQALERRGLYRMLARYQAAVFWPLSALSAIYFRWLSSKHVVATRPRGWILELLLLAAFHGWYTGAFFVSSTLLEGGALFLASQVVTGLYLTYVFAPNHLGMPLVGPGAGSGLMEQQVTPSRNVRCGPVNGFLFIGLHHQIEHHLFPGMPRWNLPRGAEATEAACRASGVAYHRVGVWTAFEEILRSLHAAGAPLRSSSRD